jgi:hypothetical protein
VNIYNSDILHHIDYSLPIVLRVDASKAGCGGQLLQIRSKEVKDDKGNISVVREEETILFFAHTFSAQAALWSTIEQECFGIFHGVTRLQDY